jgi:hypothetical protein
MQVPAEPQGPKIAVRGLLVVACCVVVGLSIAMLRADSLHVSAEFGELQSPAPAGPGWLKTKLKTSQKNVQKHGSTVDRGRLLQKARSVVNLIPSKAQDGTELTLVLQFLNEGYLTMTLSWICNVRQWGTEKSTLFIVTDEAARQGLLDFDRSLHTIYMPFTAPRVMSYGQVAYWKMMAWRSEQIHALLRAGITVFLTESDAVWFGDVSQWIPKHYQGFDFITIDDKGDGTGTGNGCVQGGFQVSEEGGYVLRPTLRPTKMSISFFLVFLGRGRDVVLCIYVVLKVCSLH